MPVSLVVLDIDGVLIDSNHRYLEAVRRTVEAVKKEPVSLADVLVAKQGGSLSDDLDCISAMLKRSEIAVPPYEELLALYLPVSDSLWREETWMPRSRILQTLCCAGVTLGLFTSRPRKELYASLWHFREHLHGVDFAAICCMEDVKKRKPDSEGLLSVLHECCGTRRETVYVGDMLDDYHAAREAVVPFIGVGTGDGEAALRDAGATRVVPSVDMLIGVIWQ